MFIASCMIHPITWGVCDHLPVLEEREASPSDQRIYVETWLTLKITGPEFRVAVYHLLSPNLCLYYQGHKGCGKSSWFRHTQKSNSYPAGIIHGK